MTAINRSSAKKSVRPSMVATRNSFAYAAEFLKKDENTLDTLFSKFEQPQEQSDNDEDMEFLDELSADDQVEEEIFFRAARGAKPGSDELAHYMLDENEFDDVSAGGLIADLQATSPDDPQFDARVGELSEYINRGI